MELDVDGVQLIRLREAPEGAEGGDVVAWGSLAVTMAPALTTALMNTLQSWLTRPDRSSVTVESGGEKLTVRVAPPKKNSS